jgi:etoposide-induced 2.4 mRNA
MSSRSFLKELKNVFLLWWQGFYDALQAQSVYRALKRDPVLRTLIFQCFLLNGVIFVGSNLLFTKGIQPLVTYLFTFEDATNSSIQSLIWLLQQFFWIAHLVLWQFPVYGISFLLSNIWYEEISWRVYEFHYPPNTNNDNRNLSSNNTVFQITTLNNVSNNVKSNEHKSISDANVPRRWRWDRFIASVADQLFKLALVLAYILVSVVWYYVPYLGLPMNFVMCCWLYSLYCFEYKWATTVPYPTFEKRIDYFEKHWTYFFGFGTPFNLACFFFPYLISYGVFAFLFPAFIIMAARAKPCRLDPSQLHFFPERVLIFQQATWLLNFVMSLMRSSCPRRFIPLKSSKK